MTAPLRVVKVGGSLLRSQPEAPAKETAASLTKWLAQQSPAVNVLVAGGGEFAEAIRRADAAHGLGEESAHWLCVDALSITARLVAAMIKVPVITEKREATHACPYICVFDPAPFLRMSEPRLFARPLPHAWAVTSDSIAARVAEFLAANELVLLKSCLLAAAGYVDDYFPTAASKLPLVRCVNLRSPDFEEFIWGWPLR
jgi:5-(aminomethyl)-3-furanmethanol phosphate kinase